MFEFRLDFLNKENCKRKVKIMYMNITLQKSVIKSLNNDGYNILNLSLPF